MLVISCHADTGFTNHSMFHKGDCYHGHMDNFVGVYGVMKAYFSGRITNDHTRIELTYDEEVDMMGAQEVARTLNDKDTVIIVDVTATPTSKDLVIFTTPNLWFPVIAHDTQLPFCHWLPIPIRKAYAKLFNRDKGEVDNLFWSPYSIRVNMKGFKPVSKWLHYSSYQKFLDTFPFYLPYGTGVNVRKMGFSKKTYYDIISKLGIYSHWFAPSLAYVYKRKNK